MLTIFDTDRLLRRRHFLQIGGTLALTNLLKAKIGAAETRRLLTDRSVIFLFLHGGPSQIETFDPKMDAPVESRSATGAVATALPGIRFGGSFPKLAARADKLAIVRSFVTGDGKHDIKPIVGSDTFGANLGSIYARVAGQNHPASGLPTNVLLFPRAVEPTALGLAWRRSTRASAARCSKTFGSPFRSTGSATAAGY
jgi:uncharacterized protein (DUF1501 family)